MRLLNAFGRLRVTTLLCLALSLCSVAEAKQAPNISEQYLLSAANQERLEHHLSPVRSDPMLAEAALAHAREMAARRTISHRFPGEPDLANRAGDAGVRFSLVTENVAEAPNASLIHDLWMQSAGHRANLLDPQVDTIGVAVVASRGQLYAVEDFARNVRQLSLSEQESRVADPIVNAGISVMDNPYYARQTCQMTSGYVGWRPWFVMRYTSADLGRLPETLVGQIETGKYHQAAIGACAGSEKSAFSSYRVAVLLYP